MIKKRLLLAILAFASSFSLSASSSIDDQQLKLVEHLTNKIQSDQKAGKSNQLILDELMSEIATQIDEKAEEVVPQESQKSSYRSIFLEIILVVAALSFGAWALYSTYQNYRTVHRMRPAHDFAPLNIHQRWAADSHVF